MKLVLPFYFQAQENFKEVKSNINFKKFKSTQKFIIVLIGLNNRLAQYRMTEKINKLQQQLRVDA